MSSKFKWQIKANGVGKFGSGLNAVLELSDSRAVVFAGNGQGKTTLSRMFRLLETGNEEISSHYLTRGHATGAFSFDINSQSDSKSCSITISKHGCEVNNTSDLLFHVFNSDYVHDNLEKRSYSPSGAIEGYIIGKEEIDLAEDKERLAELGRKGNDLRSLLENAVASAQQELKSVHADRVAEYKQITVDGLIACDQESDCYTEKLAELKALDGIPDDISPIAGISAFDIDTNRLQEMAELLSTEYSKAQFANEFLQEVREKVDFIKAGLSLSNGKSCPFCEQEYNDEAKKLLIQYNEYLEDQESRIIEQLKKHRVWIDETTRKYALIDSEYQSDSSKFDQYKAAFHDLKHETLAPLPSVAGVESSLSLISEAIKKKTADISSQQPVEELEAFALMIECIVKRIEESNVLITKINDAFSRVSARRTALKKELCSERMKKLRVDTNSLIDSIKQARGDYSNLKASIGAKEARSKRSKRSAVAESFSNLLHVAFGEKYSFDRESFFLKLSDQALGEEAAFVLSDGEKRVIAFCHYIAASYELLNEDSDADRLFFVIDDPISSMDYHHVYSVLQIIRSIGDLFGLTKTRILILTHSSAFFNMLVRNNVSKQAFILANDEICNCSSASLAPYSEHLKDLAIIASGKEPTHTTGNSLRQVLEALWRFEDPSIASLFEYLQTEKCKDLLDCEYIYTLCQDGSHGASIFDRLQDPDQDSVRRACTAVLNHVDRNYGGQLVAANIKWKAPDSAAQHN